MESQLQNPEFRNNPENFHPCKCNKNLFIYCNIVLVCACVLYVNFSVKAIFGHSEFNMVLMGESSKFPKS